MSYLRNSCYLPFCIEVEEVHSNRYGQKGYKRAARKEPTGEEMAAANERRRIKKLYGLIAMNFDFGDYHAVLTYRKDERPTPEEAKKNLRTLFQKLRKEYQKRGEPLRYIIVTEYERSAIHHHLIINDIGDTIKLIKKLWPYGGTHFTPIYEQGEVKDLAAYLIKETQKSFRKKDNPNKLAYSCSRNLKKPVIKTKIVKSNTWQKDPVPPAGYMIRRSDIVTGVNALGYPYRYYTMVRIDVGKGEGFIKPRKHASDKGGVPFD